MSSIKRPTLGVHFWEFMWNNFTMIGIDTIWEGQSFLNAIKIRECIYDFQTYRPYIGSNSKLSDRVQVDKTLLSSATNPIMKGAEQLGYLLLMASDMRPYLQRILPKATEHVLANWLMSIKPPSGIHKYMFSFGPVNDHTKW